MREVKCVKELITKAKKKFEQTNDMGKVALNREGKEIYLVIYNDTGFDLAHYQKPILSIDYNYNGRHAVIILENAYSRSDSNAINTALAWCDLDDDYETRILDGELILITHRKGR